MKTGIVTQRLIKVILVQLLLVNLLLIALLAGEIAARSDLKRERFSPMQLFQTIRPDFSLLQPQSKPASQSLHMAAGSAEPVFPEKRQKHSFVIQDYLFRYPQSVSSRSSTDKTQSKPEAVQFTATAYDLSYECCGKYPSHPAYGITFSGTRAVRGRTVAVDPAVIPIGSRLHIEFPEPYSAMTGWYTAEDTGSRVKGNIIDIYLGKSAWDEARKFGRRKVMVQVVPPESGTGIAK